MTEFKITQTNPAPGLIDFGMGNPDLSLLLLDSLHQSAEAYFASGDPRPLQYETLKVLKASETFRVWRGKQ